MLTTEPDKRRWIIDLEPLSEDEIEDAEFRGKDRAWSSLVKLFEERRAGEGLTYEQLGARIGKPKTQVHRWISSPFKMTLRACGLLAEGLDADLEINVVPRGLENRCINHLHPSDAAREWVIFSKEVRSVGATWRMAFATGEIIASSGAASSAAPTTSHADVCA